MMLPTDYNDGLAQDFEIIEQPTHTYRLRFDGLPAAGRLNGVEAMEQAVFLALHTERFQHAIFTWDYGAELHQFAGDNMDAYLQARLQTAIEQALLVDDRILRVDGFHFERHRKSLEVAFTVHTTQGDFESTQTWKGGALQ